MNLSQLAKVAGVSVATVSKAFSGSDDISPDTRQRIFDLARENGVYDRYNKHRFSKPIIAILCPEFVSNYYEVFVARVEEEILRYNGLAIAATTDFDPMRERELYNYYAHYCRADGIIRIDADTEVENPKRVPTVAIVMGHHSFADAIQLDVNAAMDAVVARLKQLGHTRIGFAGEPLTATKQAVFEQAMKKAGLPLPPERIKISHTRFAEAGKEAAEAWLAEGSLPTAVVAAYDDLALGVQQTLAAHGLEVPRDVSLVGMDDMPFSPYVTPSLSSVNMHIDEACRRAIEILLRKRDNQFYSPRGQTVLTADFVPRDSIGPAPVKR